MSVVVSTQAEIVTGAERSPVEWFSIVPLTMLSFGTTISRPSPGSM